MKNLKRAVPIFTAILLVSTIRSWGQAEEIGVFTDSAFAAYMDRADAHLERTEYYDRLQTKYAGEFYLYFLNNPDSPVGKEALLDAFVMWINTGETEQYYEAMERIDFDSDIWYDVLRLVGQSRSFYRGNNDRYLELLKDLKANITDPRSRTAVLYLLSGYYLREDEREKVNTLYHQMVTLNADEFYTEQARRFLYESETLGIGNKAPGFQAETLDGSDISIADQKGKIVVLNFWATWCGPCVREIPDLQLLRSKYAKKDVQIISISLDEDAEKLQQFLSQKVMDWPQIRQSQKDDDGIPELYNVHALPRTFLIDRDGTIVGKNLRGKRLEREIAQLL